jgi:hypothetical protein
MKLQKLAEQLDLSTHNRSFQRIGDKTFDTSLKTCPTTRTLVTYRVANSFAGVTKFLCTQGLEDRNAEKATHFNLLIQSMCLRVIHHKANPN